MTDIFEQKILCRNCDIRMKPVIANRNGFELRAMECPKCHEKIIHPADLNGMEKMKDMKGKNFHVKLRIVGNSHAISIPKEIIDFMNEQSRVMKRHMDDMLNLKFEDFGRLSVNFWDDDIDNGDKNESDIDDERESLNESDLDDINKMRIKKINKHRRENGY